MRLDFLIEGYLPVRYSLEQEPGDTYLDIGHGIGDPSDLASEPTLSWYMLPGGDIVDGDRGHVRLSRGVRGPFVASGRFDPDKQVISFVPMEKFPQMARRIPGWIIDRLRRRYPEAERIVAFQFPGSSYIPTFPLLPWGEEN